MGDGDTVVSISSLAFPPSESFNSQVSTELRYCTCAFFPPFFASFGSRSPGADCLDRSFTTWPSVDRLLLMLTASRRRSPVTSALSRHRNPLLVSALSEGESERHSPQESTKESGAGLMSE